MKQIIELINRINNILSTADSIKDNAQQEQFLKDNLLEFNEFYKNIYLILEKYQFRDKDDKEQNEIAKIVKNNILRLLKFKDNLNVYTEGRFYGKTDYENFLIDLLQSFINNEKKCVESFQNEKDIKEENFESALEYFEDKKDYIRVMQENHLYEDGLFNDSKKYFSNDTEKMTYISFMSLLQKNILTLPKEKTIEILSIIENSAIFKELDLADFKKLDCERRNLISNVIYQYCMVIIKIKSILMPETLKDDIVVRQLLDGKIKESDLIKDILLNIPVEAFANIIGYEEKKSEKGLLIEVSEYFENKGLSNLNIAVIIESLLEKWASKYEVAKLFAQIDVPIDFMQFKKSKYSKYLEWLNDFYIFDKLKECERDIEEGNIPFLPVDYYIKKIDKFSEQQKVGKHFVDNAITLLHSDFYTDEEKKKLEEALKRNGLYNEHNIPIDIAKDKLNDDLSGKNKIDKETLQRCIYSVICNSLKDKGIDIHNKVFFGKDNSDKGSYYPDEKAIWISDSMLEKYINSSELSDKAELFISIFHEMRHAIQFDNMKKGKVDYLTYNFIKELVIQKFDKKFYKDNYKALFIETDARKEQILGALEFLNGLNPEFVKIISQTMEERFIKESKNYSIYKDSKKKTFLGKIDVSDYVGLLIKYNPKILEEFSVLNIEYNLDGTKKDIQTLLQEFEGRKSDSNYRDLYSIYYGLISKQTEGSVIQDENLKQQIENFMQEADDLVTIEDMQNLYHSVNKTDMQQMYSRLYSIIHPPQNIDIGEEVRIND